MRSPHGKIKVWSEEGEHKNPGKAARAKTVCESLQENADKFESLQVRVCESLQENCLRISTKAFKKDHTTLEVSVLAGGPAEETWEER